MGGLSLTYRSESAQHTVDLIRDIRKGQDRESDISYFDELINNDPQDAVSIYFRGLAHLKKGDAEKAGMCELLSGESRIHMVAAGEGVSAIP